MTLSLSLDNRGRIRPWMRTSICAMQKESVILQSHCSLLWFLSSLWLTIYEYLHWILVTCLLTAVWIHDSSRTSVWSIVSQISYPHTTAHCVFNRHLEQALQYLKDNLVQLWWHASKFNAFQHFCSVYMLPKWEKFGVFRFSQIFCPWQDENHFGLGSNCEISYLTHDLIKTISDEKQKIKKVWFSSIFFEQCLLLPLLHFFFLLFCFIYQTQSSEYASKFRVSRNKVAPGFLFTGKWNHSVHFV